MSLISSLSEAQLQDKVNFIENYKRFYGGCQRQRYPEKHFHAGNRIDERLFHPGKPQADDGQNHPTVRQ